MARLACILVLGCALLQPAFGAGQLLVRTLGDYIPRGQHLSVREAASFLLVIPEVQSELKLSTAQCKDLQAELSEYTIAQRRAYETIKPLGGPDADRKGQEVIEEVDRIFSRRWTGLLSLPQQDRLRQIGLQALGIEGILKPEVANEIKLEGEQIGKIIAMRARFEGRKRDLQVDLAQDLSRVSDPDPADVSAVQNAKAKRKAILDRYKARRDSLDVEKAQMDEECFSILNADQKLKYSAMLGKRLKA